MKRLLQIPGVVRVGYGLKQTAGRVTQTPAYRVYVRHKRPLDDVPAAERIPTEIDGVATDVLYADQARPTTKTPSIAPGDEITRYIPNDWQASGTLGAIVQRGGERFILTNQHVLDDTSNLFEGAYDVYDPHLKTCAGIHCNHPVAQISNPNNGVNELRTEADGRQYVLDCALARVRTNVQGANRISGIGALDQGVRDLSGLADGTQVAVKKRGARTGLTSGTVVELHALDDSGTDRWELRVSPTSGHTFSGSWRLAPGVDPDIIRAAFTGTVHATITSSGDAHTLHVTGLVTGLPGDSGSIVVDEQRHVVGLLWGGTNVMVNIVGDDGNDMIDVPTGDSVVCYILPVCHALGLDPATAVIAPASPSAGVALAEDELPEHEPRWADTARALRELEAIAAATPAGRRLLGVLATHYTELADLVHHRRRVLVAWHRSRGPAFVASIVHALRQPGSALPTLLGGVRLADALARMRVVLTAEGSPALAAAIEAEAETVLRIAERATSMSELVRALHDVA